MAYHYDFVIGNEERAFFVIARDYRANKSPGVVYFFGACVRGVHLGYLLDYFWITFDLG